MPDDILVAWSQKVRFGDDGTIEAIEDIDIELIRVFGEASDLPPSHPCD